MHCHCNDGIMWLVASIEYSCLNCLVAGGFGWGDVRCERPRVHDTETSHPGQSWCGMKRSSLLSLSHTGDPQPLATLLSAPLHPAQTHPMLVTWNCANCWTEHLYLIYLDWSKIITHPLDIPGTRPSPRRYLVWVWLMYWYGPVFVSRVIR